MNGDQFSGVDAVPSTLTDRDRWLLWDDSSETPRRPHWRGDFGVSWNDSEDWRTFEEALEAASGRESWGLGYVIQPEDPFYVIDVDGPRDGNGGWREWVPDLDLFMDALTYIERSPGGGLHILVQGEPPEWWSDCEVGPDLHQGVDCLTNKFCTVTGDRVDVAGSEPADVDADEWLLEAYRDIEGDLPRMEDAEGADGAASREEWSEDAIESALESLDPDMAHDEWVRIGFAVHDWGSGSAGKRLFTAWSRDGRKFDSDAEREIDWIWNNASAGGGVTAGTLIHKAQAAGWSPPTTGGAPSPAQEGRDRSSIPSAPLGGLSPDGVAAWHELGEDGSIADLNDRQKAAAVWDLLKREGDFHVRVRRDNSSLWAFDGGVWIPDGERTLRHAGRQGLGAQEYGSNVLGELEAQARSDPSVEVAANDFGVTRGHVAVENGLVDLEAAATGVDALRDLRPDDHALAQLPVEYDPSAGYDEWAEYVEEWAEEGRADALQEYVGYCLHVGAVPIHRALLLVGSGANGKGTFLSVVRALLGRENTSSIELQTLANEKDAVADFYGSLANIDDDLSARKLGAGLGMFKKLVGGDRVRARRLYEDGFEFDATGKHLYAANEVPDVNVPDDDEAFWRRWLLVEFPNHYPPSERDPTLRDQFTEPEALSGVLNWAIEGWHRLLDQGHFTNEEHYAHAKRERWQAWGDSVDKFINECVERDPDAENVTTGDVHKRYAAWCRASGEKPASQQKLTTALKSEDVGYGTSVRVGGSVQRGYKALDLSGEVPEPEAENATDEGQVSLT